MVDFTKLSIEALRGIRTANFRKGNLAATRELTEQINHRSMQRNALGTYIGCSGPACKAAVAEIAGDQFGHEIQSAG